MLHLRTEAAPQSSMNRIEKKRTEVMHGSNIRAKSLLAIQDSNRQAFAGKGKKVNRSESAPVKPIEEQHQRKLSEPAKGHVGSLKSQ